MNFRFLLSGLLAAGLVVSVRAADPGDPAAATPTPVPATPAPKGSSKSKAAPTPKPGAPAHPGVFNRLYHTLHLSHDKVDDEKKLAESKLPNWKHVVMTMALEPAPLKLSETHQLKVTLRLENKSGKFVQLEFPTTQRIEVVVKHQPDGKLVEHWSEDQAFSNEPGMVSINPGERLEYSANIATRELVAGQTYTIEGFFPNYEVLHSSVTIAPVH